MKTRYLLIYTVFVAVRKLENPSIMSHGAGKEEKGKESLLVYRPPLHTTFLLIPVGVVSAMRGIPYPGTCYLQPC